MLFYEHDNIFIQLYKKTTHKHIEPPYWKSVKNISYGMVLYKMVVIITHLLLAYNKIIWYSVKELDVTLKLLKNIF